MNCIYLDYNATTPVAPEVLEKMLPFFSNDFGNAASITHPYGWSAEKAAQTAREEAAGLIDCQSKEIFFTSGATESNNWVVRGLLEQFKTETSGSLTDSNEPLHFVTSPVEHSSVLNSFKWASLQPGVEIDFAPVNRFGQVNVDKLVSLLRPNTKLMSFMWVNNEIGSINPMQELSALAKERKIYLHSDATQAVGKIPVSLREISVDLMSFSAHKFYGPKGVGALFVRNQNPRVTIPPLLFGGGQEKGMRSGTLNVSGVVGLGEACRLAGAKLQTEASRLSELRQSFEREILKNFPSAIINGHPTERGPNTSNITFKNQVPIQLAELAVSRGSACQSGSTSVSQVLTAIGVSPADAQNTIRFSMGMKTTEQDLHKTVEFLRKVLR